MPKAKRSFDPVPANPEIALTKTILAVDEMPIAILDYPSAGREKPAEVDVDRRNQFP
jgi:hypothetical protein